MKHLNSTNVISEIDSLAAGLRQRMAKKKDFEDIQRDVLRLCKIIFSKVGDYKEIDIKYPKPIVVVIDIRPDSGGRSRQIEVPSKKDVWQGRQTLGSKMLEVLKEARESYSLRQRLESKK